MPKALVAVCCAIFSYVVRDMREDRSRDHPLDHELIAYLGSPDFIVSSQRVRSLQRALPAAWQAVIASHHEIPPCRFHQYSIYRYLIRFSDQAVESGNELLFGADRNRAIPALAAALADVDSGTNIRRNRFTGEAPADFALAVLVEVDLELPASQRERTSVEVNLDQTTALARVLRRELGQEGGSSLPVAYGDAVFTVGSLVGTPWETIVVGRRPSMHTPATGTLVPKVMLDWLDFVDGIEMLRDLGEGLRKLNLASAPLTEYIDGVLKSGDAESYQKIYLKDREGTIAQLIESREMVDELNRISAINIFSKDSNFFRPSVVPEGYVGVDTAAAITYERATVIEQYEVLEGKLRDRDARLSEYIRDAISSRATQASDKLGRRMETLTKWMLFLAVVTALTGFGALLTDPIKNAAFSWLKTLLLTAARFFQSC